MADEKLHQLLTQLHAQLQQQSSLDDESQKLLEQVLADLQGATGEDTADLHQDLSQRIEQQAVQFEQAHPTLAEILRQIMDTLGRIGV